MKRKLRNIVAVLEWYSLGEVIVYAIMSATLSGEYIKPLVAFMMILLICVGIEIIMEIEDRQ